MIRRYLHGWYMWARALRMARRKRHGAGAMKWKYALRMAASYRWLVDGQMRGGRPPRWCKMCHGTETVLRKPVGGDCAMRML